MECVVYKITSPSGKIYIGSTINKKRRFLEYSKNRIPNQHKLKASFEKHGFANHAIEILWTGSKNEMLEMECKFGKQFKVLGRESGLNLRLPCCSETKYIFSAELIEKMRSARKGKSAYWNNKEISSYTIEGEYLKTFRSTKEAAIYYKTTPKLIRDVLKNRGRRSGGLQFRYGSNKDTIKPVILRIRKNNKQIGRYDKFNILQEKLDSVLQFTKKYHYLPANIYQCLNNKRNTAYGFKWKYI